MVVVLPARPNNGNDDTRGQLGVLVAADHDRRLLACTLYQPGRAKPVYVHAKLGIVDDRWLGDRLREPQRALALQRHRGLRDHLRRGVVRAARLRLWREHLRREDVDGDPSRVVDELWRPAAEDDAHDRLGLLPHVSRRTRAFFGPINGLVVDG